MKTQSVPSNARMIPVAKRDLIQAWSVLEKLTVSFHKIGSAYAIPQGQDDQTPEQHQAELDALDRFLSPALLREIGRARRVLVEYLPDEETERLSEHVIEYWSAQRNHKDRAKKTG